MKNVTLSAFATATLLSSTALAADLGVAPITYDQFEARHTGLNVIGSMGLGGAFLNSDDSDLDNDGIFKMGGDLRLALGAPDGFSVQFETLGSWSGPHDDETSTDDGLTNFQGGVHLIHRNSQSYAVGAFASLSGTSFAGDQDSSLHTIAGAEVAGFFGNFTAVLQGGGVWDLLESNDGWEDGWFVRGIGRYFVTPSAKVEAEIAYATGEFDCCGTSSDEYAITWGLEYEQQFMMQPLSGFIAYDGTHIEADNDYYTEHAFMVGLRFRMGEPDAMAQDRGGAGTFNLYDIHNIAGIVDEL